MNKPTEIKKCFIKSGAHVEPCEHLKNMTEGVKPQGKTRGLYVWPFINKKTGESTRTLFGAVSSHRPDGLIFNFCPWCGVDLSYAAQ